MSTVEVWRFFLSFLLSKRYAKRCDGLGVESVEVGSAWCDGFVLDEDFKKQTRSVRWSSGLKSTLDGTCTRWGRIKKVGYGCRIDLRFLKRPDRVEVFLWLLLFKSVHFLVMTVGSC
jgi:hypothetical protein